MRNEVLNDLLKYSGRGTIAHEEEVIVISVFERILGSVLICYFFFSTLCMLNSPSVVRVFRNRNEVETYYFLIVKFHLRSS